VRFTVINAVSGLNRAMCSVEPVGCGYGKKIRTDWVEAHFREYSYDHPDLFFLWVGLL
jgi:hypothetical protein